MKSEYGQREQQQAGDRSRDIYPPIEYMGRGGATNRVELISCPSHLLAILRRRSEAITSSGAPERSGVFTSSSFRANKQYRSFPSAGCRGAERRGTKGGGAGDV